MVGIGQMTLTFLLMDIYIVMGFGHRYNKNIGYMIDYRPIITGKRNGRKIVYIEQLR